MMKFKVAREHYGDRYYRAGDVREANEGAVAHLLLAGVLEKMDDAPPNKALRVPSNKASAGAPRKGRARKGARSE